MATKQIEPKHQFDGGASFPNLPNQPALGTDGSGNVVAGSSASPTPTDIDVGEVYTVAEGTQMLWLDGITVRGTLIVNGSLRGLKP